MFCDCEKSHNGYGMAGRECDCTPHIEAARQTTTQKARIMPEIYYSCCNCRDHGEGTCYPRDMVRLIPNGEWICKTCFEEDPPFTHVPKPDGWDEDNDNVPRWLDLLPVPKYAPEAAQEIDKLREQQDRILGFLWSRGDETARLWCRINYPEWSASRVGQDQST